MPQIDQLADGGALRADDDIPIERSAGTRKAHGFPTDPPGVSDTGTDTYAGNFGRDVNDEEIVAGMVDSASTTTTPTLENTGGTPTGGKTITMIDGSALWAGALQNAVHVFQYDSATDTWLLINPHLTPTGADANTVTGTAGTSGNLAEWNTDGDLVDSATAKSDVLVKPGTSTDPALAFDTWRTPNANRPTLVSIRLVAISSTTDGQIDIDVDESGGTTADYSFINLSDASAGDHNNNELMSFVVPAGGAYRIANNKDPSSNNSVGAHREFTL